MSITVTTDAVAPSAPSFAEAARVWMRIGLLSFGGPAGQIALMHKELVEERRWIGEQRFLHALHYCMLLPGTEAQQLAIYIGWLMHRTRSEENTSELQSLMRISYAVFSLKKTHHIET